MLFRDIVTNLAHTRNREEATSGISFYIRRLSTENSSRGIAAALVVTVMVFQMVTFLFPPKPSNAASPNDIMYGGFSTKTQALSRFDSRNPSDIKLIYDHWGITRQNVQDSSTVTITGSMGLYSIGRNHRFAADEQVVIPGTTTNIYIRPLGAWGAGARYTALKGRTAGGLTFYIMYDCGNLAFVGKPVVPTPTATPKPTGKIEKLVSSETTKDVNELKVEKDKIFAYTIDVSNTGPVDMRDVYVVDKAPDGIEFVPNDQTTKAEYKYMIPLLARGEKKRFVIFAKATRIIEGKLKNEACFLTNTPAAAGGCDSAFTFMDKAPTPTPTPSTTVTPTPTPSPSITPLPTVTPVPTPKVSYIKTAENLSVLVGGKPSDANGTTVKAGDRIKYNLTVNNTGGVDEKNYVFVEDITDILEYADIEDLGGSLKSEKYGSTILTWAPLTIKANSKEVKSFTVRVKSPIPDKPHSSSDTLSFDLKMDNVFQGQYVRILLPPPPAKTVETIVTSLPQTGADWPTAILAVLAAVASFIFLRNRLIKKELELMNQHVEDYSG